jgi:ribosome maturation factor RimP
LIAPGVLRAIFFGDEGMAEIIQRIRQVSEDVAIAHEAFLVDLCIRGERNSKVLEVYVDTDAGITADGCAAISRELSARLDHENLIQGRYNLIVSSPGLDRPLKLFRQYRKNLGRNLKVRYRVAEEVKTVVGRLVEVGDENIGLEGRGKEEILIPLGNIVESKIEIEFGQSPK